MKGGQEKQVNKSEPEMEAIRVKTNSVESESSSDSGVRESWEELISDEDDDDRKRRKETDVIPKRNSVRMTEFGDPPKTWDSEIGNLSRDISMQQRQLKDQEKAGKEELEKAKAETKKAKEETEKAKEETEKAKAETKKAKEETKKAKEETKKAQEETEKAKAETEKAKNETKKAQVETEKAKDEISQLDEMLSTEKSSHRQKLAEANISNHLNKKLKQDLIERDEELDLVNEKLAQTIEELRRETALVNDLHKVPQNQYLFVNNFFADHPLKTFCSWSVI
jgi:chromosome segregation ATPase